jgi:hypothetical protein
MKIPFMKPNKYQMPQIAPVPEGQDTRNNGVYINEEKRCFRIDIFDQGKPGTLEQALGTLEVAKDIIKHHISMWHAREQRRSAILVPKGNGHG